MKQRKYKDIQKLWIFIFIAPSMVLFCGFYLWPFLLSLVSSFTQWNGFTEMKFIGFENYINLFRDDNFVQAMLNTLYAALLGVFVHVPFGVVLALVLSRKGKGWRFTRSLYMIPNIISGAGLALMFSFIYRPSSGLIAGIQQFFGMPGNINFFADPRYAFISVQMMWLLYAAVITLITLAELLSVSNDIHEAARIDGVNEFQMDWYINLPMIKRIVGTGMILTITSVFRTFDIIYISTQGGPGNKTLNLAVMMVNSVTRQTRYGFANAIGIILLIMGVIVMLVSNRIFKMDKET